MGKDLKGRELGVGLVQKKDGRYSARVTDYNGKRREKCFNKISDARKWIAEANVTIRESEGMNAFDMKCDDWFDFWQKSILINSVETSTRNAYTNRYKNSISPRIGNMTIDKVKPFHCQMVLNDCVDSGLCNKTISLTRNVMSCMFQAACENALIVRNPVNGSVKAKSFTREKKKYMTKEEQDIFNQYLNDSIWYSHNDVIYNAFLLILQTGMRIGELMALKWTDIDFNNRAIHVRSSMRHYKTKAKDYTIGSTKTESGDRIIPMTNKAYEILQSLPVVNASDPKFKDIIFLQQNGLPYHVGTYKDAIQTIFRNIPVEYISIHGLRHTFATRCIECGMKPKTLQTILGHKSLTVTMDLYVHTSESEKFEEMRKLEGFLV